MAHGREDSKYDNNQLIKQLSRWVPPMMPIMMPIKHGLTFHNDEGGLIEDKYVAVSMTLALAFMCDQWKKLG